MILRYTYVRMQDAWLKLSRETGWFYGFAQSERCQNVRQSKHRRDDGDTAND